MKSLYGAIAICVHVRYGQLHGVLTTFHPPAKLVMPHGRRLLPSSAGGRLTCLLGKSPCRVAVMRVT